MDNVENMEYKHSEIIHVMTNRSRIRFFAEVYQVCLSCVCLRGFPLGALLHPPAPLKTVGILANYKARNLCLSFVYLEDRSSDLLHDASTGHSNALQWVWKSWESQSTPVFFFQHVLNRDLTSFEMKTAETTMLILSWYTFMLLHIPLHKALLKQSCAQYLVQENSDHSCLSDVVNKVNKIFDPLLVLCTAKHHLPTT